MKEREREMVSPAQCAEYTTLSTGPINASAKLSTWSRRGHSRRFSQPTPVTRVALLCHEPPLGRTAPPHPGMETRNTDRRTGSALKGTHHHRPHRGDTESARHRVIPLLKLVSTSERSRQATGTKFPAGNAAADGEAVRRRRRVSKRPRARTPSMFNEQAADRTGTYC